jgi:ABC-type bacteriocin/lantibiotic exporter with double-glycine peptidase domain
MLILQSDNFTCGSVATANAIVALGGKVTVAKVKRHTGTTPEHGVTHHGIMQAIERLGYSYTELMAPFKEAFDTLVEHLQLGGSAVILTQNGNHWEAAVGVLGRRVIVFDSAPNKGKSGVSVLSQAKMKNLWSPNAKNGRYALLISKTL